MSSRMVQQLQLQTMFDDAENEVLDRFRSALNSFAVPSQEALKRPRGGFSRCPVAEIDGYFEFVTKVGKPCFKWDVIRPAFLWKLQLVMSEMILVEKETNTDCIEPCSTEGELREQCDFIFRKASEFEGTPFTFQRLCELIMTPSRHYKRADKYLRALEKNINVVTTVTEDGERITGVDDFEPQYSESMNGPQNPFFVKVDECDLPLETRMFHTDHSNYMGENGVCELNGHQNVESMTPINLSAANKKAENRIVPEGQKEDALLKTETEGNVAMEVNGGNVVQLEDKMETVKNAEVSSDEVKSMDMEY
ncbi:hypothetical protein AB6A40_004559 [Gnathostoma spinigerum]|uniref:Uncharacterized protein n=1 Tax=Gnathostoma spinigerum TaxID=75299 RepID=A0ABD6ENJ7_9BILA